MPHPSGSGVDDAIFSQTGNRFLTDAAPTLLGFVAIRLHKLTAISNERLPNTLRKTEFAPEAMPSRHHVPRDDSRTSRVVDHAIELEVATSSLSAPGFHHVERVGDLGDGGDTRAESIACESFGSVRGSGDRPGLQTQCGV